MPLPRRGADMSTPLLPPRLAALQRTGTRSSSIRSTGPSPLNTCDKTLVFLEMKKFTGFLVSFLFALRKRRTKRRRRKGGEGPGLAVRLLWGKTSQGEEGEGPGWQCGCFQLQSMPEEKFLALLTFPAPCRCCCANRRFTSTARFFVLLSLLLFGVLLIC